MTDQISAKHDLLEKTLKETLDPDIIAQIARKKKLTIRKAMDIYYKSKLSIQIDKGEYGIHYLDAAYLADDLIENEKELFIE